MSERDEYLKERDIYLGNLGGEYFMESEVVVGGVYIHLGNPEHEYTILERIPNHTEWERKGIQAGWAILYRQEFDGEKHNKGDILTRSEWDFKGITQIEGSFVSNFQFVRMSEDE